MDSALIMRFVGEKLRDPTTYVLALIVGTIINLYGQLLLPWFRGSFDPPVDLLIEFEIRPEVTVFSIFLGYAFPFCVGLYSAVTARYKARRIESPSSLPEHAPDPMFRAERSGRLVEAGAATWRYLNRYGVERAQQILGDELWARIVSKETMDDRPTVYFEPDQAAYVVAHAPADDEHINIYLARLPRALEARSRG